KPANSVAAASLSEPRTSPLIGVSSPPSSRAALTSSKALLVRRPSLVLVTSRLMPRPPARMYEVRSRSRSDNLRLFVQASRQLTGGLRRVACHYLASPLLALDRLRHDFGPPLDGPEVVKGALGELCAFGRHDVGQGRVAGFVEALLGRHDGRQLYAHGFAAV